MWKFTQDKAIYLQISEYLLTDIIAGKYLPGERLPSVRDLSMQAAVNPNTAQKALSYLENTGIITAQRTTGWFVTENADIIKSSKEKCAENLITELKEKLSRIGISNAEIIEMLKKEN